MQAFPEDEPVPMAVEAGLISANDAEALLAALDGTGVRVTAESNALHRIGDGPLRLVTHPSAITATREAACVDGLDPRQHAMLRQLQQPGERLPLLLFSAEAGAFRVTLCAWLGGEGMREVRSFADLKALAAAWDGKEAPTGAWQAARANLRLAAQGIVADMAGRAVATAASKAAAQIEAVRLRLVDELGRLLICFDPDTDDLNGKLHRLASEQTPTAHRLQNVFGRLGGYLDWEGHWSGPHQTGHAAWLADCRAMNSRGERMRKPE